MAKDEYEETDDIALLYDDVLAALLKGKSIAMYDLDSLLEVYDYAYDLSDEYVMSEVMTHVLMRSSRFAPMLERKAIKLLQVSETEGAKAVALRLPQMSFIRSLILAQIEWDAENWRDSYRKMFKTVKPGAIDDFGAMCLIDLALGVDDLKHIVMQLPEINKLMEYPADFMTDLSMTLYEQEQYDAAVTVLQELTIVEPFEIDHWLRLADIFDKKLENEQEALSALEYALAIDPKSAQAKLMFGELKLKMHDNITSVIDIADSLLPNRQYHQDALYLKAGALIEQEKLDEAMAILELYLDECPNPMDIFLLIFSIADGKLSEKLASRFVDCLDSTEPQDVSRWFDNARRMLSNGTCKSMINYALRSDLQKLPVAFWNAIQRVIYQDGKYEAVITNYNNRYGSAIEVECRLLFMLSKLRLGDKSGVAEMADEMLERTFEETKMGGPSAYIMQITYAKACFDIKDYLATLGRCKLKKDKLDVIDPFL